MNCILQHDTMECGTACLSMIFHEYSISHTLEAISNQYKTTSEGVSLYTLSVTAQKYGFQSICGRVNISKLICTKHPCILHWNKNHFVTSAKPHIDSKIINITH